MNRPATARLTVRLSQLLLASVMVAGCSSAGQREGCEVEPARRLDVAVSFEQVGQDGLTVAVTVTNNGPETLYMCTEPHPVNRALRRPGYPYVHYGGDDTLVLYWAMVDPCDVDGAGYEVVGATICSLPPGQSHRRQIRLSSAVRERVAWYSLSSKPRPADSPEPFPEDFPLKLRFEVNKILTVVGYWERRSLLAQDATYSFNRMLQEYVRASAEIQREGYLGAQWGPADLSRISLSTYRSVANRKIKRQAGPGSFDWRGATALEMQLLSTSGPVELPRTLTLEAHIYPS